MITLEEQQEILKPILETVPGLTTVRTDFPGAVQHDQLPLLWLSAGEAEYDQVTRGAQSLRIRRTWKAVLLVEKVELGNTFQAEEATKPFLTAIPVKLAAYPTLKLADGCTFDLRLDKRRDEGVRKLRFDEVTGYTGTIVYFFTVVEDDVVRFRRKHQPPSAKTTWRLIADSRKLKTQRVWSAEDCTATTSAVSMATTPTQFTTASATAPAA
jgi:hypothetical protein